MDGHFGPDCPDCPSSYFENNCASICNCSNDEQCHYGTCTWMHKSTRYVDVLRDNLRQTFNQFHRFL